MIRLIVIAVLALAVVLFTTANLGVVELNTVVSQNVRASLALLLFIAFASGYTVATLVGLHRSFKRRLRERAQLQSDWEAEAALLPAPPRIVIQPDQPQSRRLARQ